MNRKTLVTGLLMLVGIAINAQKQITVFANKSVTKVSPTMWRFFFDNINFAAGAKDRYYKRRNNSYASTDVGKCIGCFM